MFIPGKLHGGSRIFLEGGGDSKSGYIIIMQFLAENCMKMKEFGPQRGRASPAPPMDLPMINKILPLKVLFE